MSSKDKSKEKKKGKEKAKDKGKSILSFFVKKKPEEVIKERYEKTLEKYKNYLKHYSRPKRVFDSKNIRVQNFSEDELKRITKCQATVRRFLVLKEKKIASYQQMVNTRNALLSLVRIENRFLNNLEIAIKEYLIPLRSSKYKGTKYKSLKKVLETLFSNIEELYAFHQKLHNIFEHYAELWPCCQNIGENIIQMLWEFTVYERYVIEIAEFSPELRDLKDNKSQIVSFIESIDNKRKEKFQGEIFRDLKALVRLPTKHLFRYKYHLKKLAINTPSASKDYLYRIYIAACVREVGLYIAYRYDNSLARREMFKLQERIISKANFTIDIPTRKLVRQGEMLVNNKPVRQVFLFNDICMITKIQNRVTFLYEDHADLKGAKLRRLYTDGLKQVFSLVSAENQIFTFSLTNNSKSKSWQKSFEDALSKRNDQIFGAKITELLEKDSTPIPKMLFSVAYRLNRALYQNKVFRSAGDPYLISSLTRRFNNHIHEVNLSESSASDVAALLVFYLESLPEPVFPISARDAFFKVNENEFDEVLVFNFFRTNFQNLPVANKNLFEFIVFLLHYASTKEKEFKLSTVELAVLFSPLLFRPSKRTFSTCLIMPRIVNAFEVLLTKPSKVFDIPDNLALPKSIDEFINADLFGDWWRAFRIGHPPLFSFISESSNLLQLLKYINIASHTQIDTERKYLELLQRGSYATLILTHDGVITHMFQNEKIIQALFSCIESDETEETLSYIRDIMECLFEYDSEKTTSLFRLSPRYSELLIEKCYHGNIVALLNSLVQLSILYQTPKYYEILDIWGFKVIELFCSKSLESWREETLENLSTFMCKLFEDHLFFKSERSKMIFDALSDPSTIHSLIDNIFNLPIEKSKSIVNILISLLTKKVITEDHDIVNDKRMMSNNENDDLNSDVSESDNSKSESDSENEGDSNNNNNNNNNGGAGDNNALEFEVLPHVSSLIIEIILKRIASFETMLEEPLKRRQPLGCQRVLIIQFISSLLLVQRDSVAELLISSNIIGSLVDLFFLYPNNNILHCYVVKIIDIITKNYTKNQQVMTLLFNDTCLIEKVASSLEIDKNSGYNGHLLQLGELLYDNQLITQIVQSKNGWDKVVSRVNDYKKATKVENVQRKHRNYTIDRYEDRI